MKLWKTRERKLNIRERREVPEYDAMAASYYNNW